MNTYIMLSETIRLIVTLYILYQIRVNRQRIRKLAEILKQIIERK